VYHHFHDSSCQIVLDRRRATAGHDRSRQLDVAIQLGRKIINRRLQPRYNLRAVKSSGLLQRFRHDHFHVTPIACNELMDRKRRFPGPVPERCREPSVHEDQVAGKLSHIPIRQHRWPLENLRR
jgi:hypothetical protein